MLLSPRNQSFLSSVKEGSGHFLGGGRGPTIFRRNGKGMEGEQSSPIIGGTIDNRLPNGCP